MTAWWVIDDEVRDQNFWIDPKEAIQETKNCYRVIATRWGNVAGITEACHIYPRRPSTWHREDPKVRENLDVLAADRVHCESRLAERRMLEGDPASLRAVKSRPRGRRSSPRKERRHQDWLNRKIYTDDELKVKLEELGYPDGWDRKPDFVMPDDPNAVQAPPRRQLFRTTLHSPPNAGTRRP